jgi:ribosomal protein S18
MTLGLNMESLMWNLSMRKQRENLTYQNFKNIWTESKYPTEREKIFPHNITDQVMISEIYNKLL